MREQHVWNVLNDVETHLEKARDSIREIRPPDLSNDSDDFQGDYLVNKVTNIERDLSRAIAEARAASFMLVEDVTITVEEDEDFDPSDHIDP